MRWCRVSVEFRLHAPIKAHHGGMEVESDTKEYLVIILNYVRRLEISATEDARRHDALMKTLEELIPGASVAYTRHYEKNAKTLLVGPVLDAINRTIGKLEGH